MPHQQPVLPVTTADDHRFELIQVPAEQPRARMLFLPGMGLTARQYIRFGQALSGHGIESYIHEWRGLGSSSQRASRSTNWGYRELLAFDLVAAQDRIEAESNQGPLIIAGHSLGSQLACLLAALRPEHCHGIAIIAGGSPYWRSFGWLKGGALLTALNLMPGIASLVGHYPGRQLGFAGREARSVMADWARTGRTGVYQAPGIEQDLEAALGRLSVPVLGLRLADDWFVPEASLSWLTNKLTSARVTQHRVQAEQAGQTADHYSWMRQPGPCAQAIAQWLADEITESPHSAEAISRA
jgi:predicted alpha/beta hydrolase